MRAERVYYVENGTTAAAIKGVYALVDNNNDDDAQDPGERRALLHPAHLGLHAVPVEHRPGHGWMVLSG